MGSMDDRDYFTDHYQLLIHLKADDKEARQNPLRARRIQVNDEDGNDEKRSRVIVKENVTKRYPRHVVANNNDDSQQKKYSTASTGTRIVHHSTL
jgi:hypothetical protein